MYVVGLLVSRGHGYQLHLTSPSFEQYFIHITMFREDSKYILKRILFPSRFLYCLWSIKDHLWFSYRLHKLLPQKSGCVALKLRVLSLYYFTGSDIKNLTYINKEKLIFTILGITVKILSIRYWDKCSKMDLNDPSPSTSHFVS